MYWIKKSCIGINLIKNLNIFHWKIYKEFQKISHYKINSDKGSSTGFCNVNHILITAMLF